MPFSRLYLRLLHGAHLIARPMTLGVRAAIFDAAGRVFLVRHSYVRGWYLPGGGVDPGETAQEALHREAWEEGNLVLPERPHLFAVYFNRHESNRDHVIFYVARNAFQKEPKRPDREILDAGFFAMDALPPDLTPASERRLAEIAGTHAVDPYW